MTFISFVFIMGVLFLIFACLWIYTINKFLKRYDEFTRYMFSINDEETLRKIGRINESGEITVAGKVGADEVLIQKYRETGDEEYLLFADDARRFGRRFYAYAIAMFMVFVIFSIFEEDFKG